MGLFVPDAPKVQPFSFPVMTQINEKITVVCSSKQGSQPLEFQWYKNNNRLQESNNIKIKSMDDISILTIESVRSVDSGNYTCSVSNGHGKDRYSAILNVDGKKNFQLVFIVILLFYI